MICLLPIASINTSVRNESEVSGLGVCLANGSEDTKKIADATRQCVNARIQGSAADLTKIAMIELNKNERLKELGFRMLIPIHDEILAECPEVNMRECSKLLAETMSKAAEKILQMPIKCDVAISKCWYGDEIMLD